jgi:hypothetical protein
MTEQTNKQIIDINKTYRTRSGLRVELYKIYDPNEYDDDEDYLVHGAVFYEPNSVPEIQAWTINGAHSVCEGYSFELDLFEYNPHQDLPVDTKMVIVGKHYHYVNRLHFSHVSSNGVYTYPVGSTSWSAPSEVACQLWEYNNYYIYTDEEYAKLNK